MYAAEPLKLRLIDMLHVIVSIMDLVFSATFIEASTGSNE
jgi:hypothetical protein